MTIDKSCYENTNQKKMKDDERFTDGTHDHRNYAKEPHEHSRNGSNCYADGGMVDDENHDMGDVVGDQTQAPDQMMGQNAPEVRGGMTMPGTMNARSQTMYE